MTTASLPEMWAALRTPDPAQTAGDFRMRLCHDSLDLRVLAAVSGAPPDAAIVVEIPERFRPRRLNTFSGRRLSVLCGELPGLSAGRIAVVVNLRDREFEDLFAQLGDELLRGIRAAGSVPEAIQSITRLIERRRRFLDQRHAPLSGEEVRGLIGELAVLERLTQRVGVASALASWKAPRGSIRDFECPDRTVEVKTYMASGGATVRINDPMQLEPEGGIPLFLVCQELARSQMPELALAGHVARVGRLFAQDLELAEEFGNALAASGYLPSHSALYTESYSLSQVLAFRVLPRFPRISPRSVPAGISQVQFSIGILQLTQFTVDADTEVGPVPPRSSDQP